MDAKAKVGAWQWQGGDGQWRECTFHGREEYIRAGYDVRELVTLTDHEAALAELENLRRMYCTLEGQYQVVTESKASLLTGLEALAGEWERRAKAYSDDVENQGAVSGRNGYWFQAAAEVSEMVAADIRRTLTNSAKESNTMNTQPNDTHTTEDDYQHFLSYSGLGHSPLLQYAYYHGADVGMEKPKGAAANPESEE